MARLVPLGVTPLPTRFHPPAVKQETEITAAGIMELAAPALPSLGERMEAAEETEGTLAMEIQEIAPLVTVPRFPVQEEVGGQAVTLAGQAGAVIVMMPLTMGNQARMAAMVPQVHRAHRVQRAQRGCTGCLEGKEVRVGKVSMAGVEAEVVGAEARHTLFAICEGQAQGERAGEPEEKEDRGGQADGEEVAPTACTSTKMEQAGLLPIVRSLLA